MSCVKWLAYLGPGCFNDRWVDFELAEAARTDGADAPVVRADGFGSSGFAG